MNEEVLKTIDVIQKGGVILYPTDTVWGIGCDSTNSEAVEKIFKVKERVPDKAFVSLVADVEQLKYYIDGELNDKVLSLINQHKKPLTVIFPKGKGVNAKVMSSDGSIALRVVSDPFCKVLIKKMGVPLVSTSANISGRQTARTYSEIEDTVLRRVDYIVNWRRFENEASSPSSIVKILNDGSLHWIRE